MDLRRMRTFVAMAELARFRKQRCACALHSLRCPMPPYAESFREALAEHMREVLPIKRPSVNLHIARNSAQVSIISTAMKTKFHRARGKLGPLAARRLSLRDRHRMLTAQIV